jgi:two-component system cell cycle response regulator CtrA
MSDQATERERQQARRIRELLGEVEDLKARVEQLEDMLTSNVSEPILDGLTRSEGVVLGLLMQREVATKDMIMTALYGHRLDADDTVGDKIVDVFVCKLRRKIKGLGIFIETQRGVGYFLSRDSKAMVKKLRDEAA